MYSRVSRPRAWWPVGHTRRAIQAEPRNRWTRRARAQFLLGGELIGVVRAQKPFWGGAGDLGSTGRACPASDGFERWPAAGSSTLSQGDCSRRSEVSQPLHSRWLAPQPAAVVGRSVGQASSPGLAAPRKSQTSTGRQALQAVGRRCGPAAFAGAAWKGARTHPPDVVGGGQSDKPMRHMALARPRRPARLQFRPVAPPPMGMGHPVAGLVGRRPVRGPEA